ncbi:MAG: nucleotidyltransferase domain-containing protein [Myxococcales bacterium]|nr:nucleotidyltransferase domain-containing protein [Myxococcales bacterium]MCB9580245.1 nucleotidyltransferase domain-containing protein [Polyangiaceae bacterium]
MGTADASSTVGRDAVVVRLRGFFESWQPEFAAVYLFGSEARGEARPDSDVDIAVIRKERAQHPSERLHADLAGALERVIDRPVEVIDLEGAPVDLVHRILTDAILIHETDRSKRIAVETRRRAEYFDMKPILAAYRHLPSAE